MPKKTEKQELTAHQLAFLKAYGTLGTILRAAEAAYIDRSTHYDWLDKSPLYAEAFEVAKLDYRDFLFDCMNTRATVGTIKKIKKDKNGNVIELIREYSDELLARLGERADPSFKRKQEIDVRDESALKLLREKLGVNDESADC